MKKIATVQTAFGGLYEVVEKQIRKEVPEELTFTHVLDSTLIADVVRSQGMTDALKKRTKALLAAASSSGANLVICTCSSVGDAVDEYAAEHPEEKIMRIDYPMAKYVIGSNAKKVVVLATLSTTVDPSVSLIRRMAEQEGKQIEVVPATIDGAFEAMTGGDMEKASSIVRAYVQEHCAGAPVIVLAQASMALFMPVLRDVLGDDTVILDSPSTCAAYLKENL